MSRVPLPKTSTRAVPPVESFSKKMVPPKPPPLAINVALPAVEVSSKPVTPPPLLVIVALPAVEVSTKSVTPPLLVIVALPAVEVSEKTVKPPPLLVIAALPAVELFKKLVPPPKSLIIVCVWAELFTMPTPTKEKEFPFVSIVKASAPELNVMESMVTSPERNSEVTLEELNVAVSPGLTGAIAGVQLPPVFQLPDNGQQFQTASTASAGAAMVTNNRRDPRAVAKNP